MNKINKGVKVVKLNGKDLESSEITFDDMLDKNEVIVIMETKR